MRLALETLEDRLAPATFIWTGASGSTNWSVAGNWAGGVAPSASSQLADLVFGSLGAGHLSAVNNINGLNVNSIQISNLSGYTISGSQINLGSPSQPGSGTIVVGTGLAETITLDMNLSATNASQQFVTIDSGATLLYSGHLSGITGSQLTKEGTGTLRLTGDNATYIGPFNIDHDAGIVSVEQARALGGAKTNSVQQVQLTNATTATQFRLTFGTQQTAPISYTGTLADGAAVKAALDGLSNIGGAGGFSLVTQTNSGATETFVITLGGSLAGNPQTAITCSIVTGPGTQNSSVLLTGGLTSSNVVIVGNNSQIQLNSVAGGSVANSLQLFGPGVSNLGSLVNATGNNTWSGSIAMGTNSTVNVATGTTLNIAGSISDMSSPFNLTKMGAGTLILSNANTYRGTTNIQNGTLNVQHPLALGSVPSAGTFTQVNTISGERGNLALQYTLGSALPPNSLPYYNLQDPTQPYNALTNPYVGFTVPNYRLLLLGGGLPGNTSVENILGNNAWTGPIIVNGTQAGFTNAFFRVDTDPTGDPTSLRISGVIMDQSLAAPANLFKEGGGTLILSPSIVNVATGLATATGTPNLFAGTMQINGGVIQLEDSQGLGPITNVAGTTVTPGTALYLVSNVGHVDSVTSMVNRLRVSEPLNLQGTGISSDGALRSVSGINTYTFAMVQSPTQNAVAGVAGGSLTIGTTFYYVVTALDGYGESLTSNQQSFTPTATAQTARITWAQVPGATGYRIYRTTSPGLFVSPSLKATVVGGATLTFDDTAVGALANGAPPTVRPIITAANAGAGAFVGVDPEPIQTGNANYFTNDYSLTINGGISTPANLLLTKVGSGHLILPNANNQLLGNTEIREGWITVQAPQALGPSTTDVQETEATVTVDNSAALMLKPLTPGSSFVFTHNLVVQGVGIKHPFALINEKGAVENIAGINQLAGNIKLTGQVGLGVEQLDPAVPSDLTTTGEISGQVITQINVAGQAQGGPREDDKVIDTGGTAGTITINANVLGIPDDIRVYLGDFVASPSSSVLVYDSTTNGDFTNPTNANRAVITIVYSATTATATAVLGPGGTNWNLGPVVTNYAALTSTKVTIVVNQGNSRQFITQWNYTATIVPSGNSQTGGILKLGSQRLVLQGPGIYAGGVDVREGIIRVENENALGTPASTAVIEVEPGTAIELAPNVAAQNGGLTAGGSFWNTHLVVSGTGNSAFGDAPLEVLGNDVMWHGPITLKPNIAIKFEGALANQAVQTLAAVTVDNTGSPTLTGANASLAVVTSTPGGNGQNAVQSLVFSGAITGGFFKLTYNNGVTSVTTGNIQWDADPTTLIANLILRLTSVLGAGNFNVVKTSPIMDVHPNTRFVVDGVIDDGKASVSVVSPLIHDYQLNGSYADALGGPALTPVGGTLGPTSYSWAAVSGNNQGLRLFNALPDPANYSVEMVFNFAAITSWRNIMDFKNRTTDEGLYNFSTALQFYLSAGTPSSPQTGPNNAFAPNVNVHLVVTRDSATENFIGYINGVQQFTFVDVSDAAIFDAANNVMAFFIDDLVVPNEVSAGVVDMIRIYNRPLTQSEVTTIFNGGTLGGTTVGAGTPSDLTVSGGGELVLSGANTYRGGTFINQGIVTLATAQGLGAPGIAGSQELSLTGVVAGTSQFRLSFGGAQTSPITYTGTGADAVNIRNALNGLSTIGGVGGSVKVIEQNSGVYLITFGGTLAGIDSPTIGAQVTAGVGAAAVTANGGTFLANQAQLQLEGGITVGGEPLTLQGTGNNLQSTVQTYTVSSTSLSPTGAYTLRFNGVDTAPLPFSATAGDVQRALQGLSTVNNPGGSVEVNLSSVNPGQDEVQRFTFVGLSAGSTYQIYFDPSNAAPKLGFNLTPAITFTGNPFTDRARVVAALQALLTVSGLNIGGTVSPGPTAFITGGEFVSVVFQGGLANRALPLATATLLTGAGSVFVSETTGGVPSSRSFVATFLGNFTHQNQPLLTVPSVTGNTTVATPTSVVVGGTPNATPTQWFPTGPNPIGGANVFSGAPLTFQATAGRVTGVAAQATFADDIFISTAGGGFWRTIDGGAHWAPLFDSAAGSVPFGGAVAALNTPSPNPVYFGTGEGNNSTDSYYGSGVYKYENGKSTLLTNPDSSNPLAGKAITKIVINRTNPLMIWVAVSDMATNGTGGNAGIWRYDGVNWLNMGAGPAAGLVYSDLALDANGTRLYAAIGLPVGSASNDILVCNNPTAATPTWTAAAVGAGAGTIRIAASTVNDVAYAVLTNTAGSLLRVIRTIDGGVTWAAVAAQPTNFLNPLGNYASAIVVWRNGANDQVFVAGHDQGSGTNFVLWSKDGGATAANWVSISTDAGGFGPHSDVHGLALDINRNLIVGSDGGVWRAIINYAAGTLTRWNDLNGDLFITQFNAVSAQPGNTGVILGGTQNNGTALFDGDATWAQVNPSVGIGNFTSIRFVPGNGTLAYSVANGNIYRSVDSGATWTLNRSTGTAIQVVVDSVNPARVLSVAGGTLLESTDGGNSYNNIAAPASLRLAAATYQGTFIPDPFFPLVVDNGANTYDPDTIYLASATNLFVTKNHGLTFTGTTAATSNRTPPLVGGTTIQSIEVDPSNRNIVYVVTSGAVGTAGTGRVFRTLDSGLTWTDISAGLPRSPLNNSVLAAWDLVIDYRTNDLYLGTDDGVWKLVGASGSWTKFGAALPNVQVKDLDLNTSGNVLIAGTYGRGVWQYFLDDNTLPNAPLNPGALRSIAGDNSWTGPITLAGPTTISANGSQALQNGLSAASLSIFGVIGDLPGTSANTLTKIGGGDVILAGANTYAGTTDVREGNVVIRNPNALGGAAVAGSQTLAVIATPPPVQKAPALTTGGVIPAGIQFFYEITAIGPAGESIASNEVTITTNAVNQAIVLSWNLVDGATSYRIYRSTAAGVYTSPALVTTIPSGTTTTFTDTGAGLLSGSPQVLRLSFSFNGFTSASIPFTSTSADAAAIQTLLNSASFTTIGGIGETVTVVAKGPGLFQITFNGPTLANTTLPIVAIVSSGVGSASTTPGGGTIVENGAALELQSSLNLEPITLNGNGIAPNYGGHFTGALRSLSNTNTYTGTITLNTNATIGVDTGSALTIASVNPFGIIDNGRGFSLTKEGDGKLTLTNADSYGSATAGTTVEQGILNIQQSNALGVSGTTTMVRDGAQLQLQSPTGPVQLDPVASPGGTIPNGTTFFYEITAIGPSGETLASNEKSITTSAPNRRIDLSWVAVPGATGYKIYRSTTAAPYTSPALLATIGSGTTTTFSDTGAAVAAGTPPTGTLNVTTENLVLSGSGIGGTGALLNVAGNNQWGSAATTVALTSAPAFSPITMPAGAVTIDVANASDTLTLNSSVTEPLPTGLTKVGAGRLTLTQNDTYSGTTNINEGTLRITNSGALGTNAGQEIQRITTFDSLGTGQFTLTFNGFTTGLLSFGLPATGGVGPTGSVQNALSALGSIGVGNVNVTRTTITVNATNGPQTGFIYTVTFVGALAQAGQNLMTTTPTGSIAVAISRVASGGIGTLVTAGASLEMDNNISVPAAESLMLNGTGVGSLGALHNISGANTWAGKVTLQSSSTVAADPASRLTISGAVQDPSPNLVPPPDLTKIGQGTLALPNANTYTGNTFIQQGVLNIQNAASLGANTSSIQTVTVVGTSGSFTLFYNGTPTSPLLFGATAGAVKAALDPLVQAVNATNFVTVTQLGNTYTIAFNGGALVGTNQSLLTATFTSGIASVAIAPVLMGAESATVVSSGAALQMENATSFTESSGKSLILNGPGFNGNGALENVAGSNVAGILPVLLASNSSVGADGASRLSFTQPISDQSQTQSITFNAFSTGDFYTLSFDGLSTGILTFSASRATNATNIAAALNALATVSLRGGVVSVPTPPAGNTYAATFGGRMIGTNWPQITGAAISGGGSFTINRVMNSNSLNVDKVGTGTVEYTGTSANLYTGLTHVIAGTLDLNKPSGVDAIVGDLTVGTPGIAEVQTLTITGSSGTFALTFNGQTTGNLNFNVPGSGGAGPLASVQNALNALSSIGGVGGSVAVTKSANVYTITFGGTLAGANLPPLAVSGSAAGNVVETVAGSRFAPIGSAVTRLLVDHQINNNSNVLVNGDGLLNLNDHTEDLNRTLRIVDGQVNTGNASLVLLAGLNMTGGTINDTNSASPGGIDLQSNVTATSTATGSAVIQGAGNVNLHNATRTLTVNEGPNTSDLFIASNITDLSGNPAAGVTKAGPGRLELGAVNGYLGITQINAGDTQVDAGASIQNVLLNGGSLSGRGTVGTVTMLSTGTVNPGYNGPPPVIGTLTSGNVAWTSNATFFVDVKHTSAGAPVAGVDNDLLNVVGTITLGNALLTGFPGAGVAVNDQFTILHSAVAMNFGAIPTGIVPSNAFDGIIAGTRAPIAQDGTVFLGGQKFTVHYFANDVVLTRQFATFTSLTISSSANPSKYGQEVTYTVTAVPEPGATLLTANPRVTLTVDGGVLVETVTMNPVTGIATFKPQSDFNFTWAPTVPPPPGAPLPPHVITAEFNDTLDVFASNQVPTPSPINQVIEQNTVGITLSSTPVVTATAPVYGQGVNIVASILPTIIPNTPTASNPTGTVTFVVDPGTPGQLTYQIALSPPYVGPPAARTATLTLPGNLFLSPGVHIVRTSYDGDTNFAASATPVDFSLDIKSDGTVTTLLAAPATTHLGQQVIFTMRVDPALVGSLGTPLGTLDIYDGSTSNPPMNSSPIPYNGTSVSFPTSNLLLGAHTIIAAFTPAPGNTNYTASTRSINYIVTAATTATSIVSVSPNPLSYGVPTTFNLHVEPNPVISSSFGLPSGTITLWDGPPNTGTNLGTGAVNPGNGDASVTTTAFALSAGTHLLSAVYSGDGSFGQSTGTITVTVSQAPTSVAVDATPSSGADFGTSVQLRAVVTSIVGTPPTGVGSGSRVTFVDTTNPGTPITLGTGNLAAGGIATLNTSVLPVGSRTITATYVDTFDNNFATSSGTLTGFAVAHAPTNTLLSVDVASGTGVYGQPVTFTATLTSPGGLVTTGTGSNVTFVDNTTSTTLGTADIVVGPGNTRIATLTTNTLAAGTHNITATYNDTADTFFLTSSGNLNNYAVNPAATVILSGDFTASPPVSGLTQTVTFSAHVSANSPSTAVVNTGSVTFRDITGAPVVLGTSSVNATTGIATLAVSSLSIGFHTIEATYTGGPPNFLASGPATLTQEVRNLATINASAISGAVFGQPLTYAVSVTGAPGTPTGTVTIMEGAATLGSGTLSGGSTAVGIGSLSAGTHNLVFNYSGDPTFAPATRTIVQVVSAANTTTTLSALPPKSFGETVTLTATITTNSPSLAAAPTTGAVSFFDGATLLQTVNLSGSNIATYSTSQLSMGSHTITASYSGGAPNYANSSTSATQQINGVATSTNLAPLSSTTYGNPVTFNVTVTPATGTAVPTGTVTFRDGANVLATKSLTNGAASFTTTATQLAVGNHSITVVYTPANASFAASTSAAQNQAVAPATTVTLIGSSAPSGAVYGQSVTFTASTIVTSGGSPGIPQGNMLFFDGTTLVANVPMINGSATYTTTAMNAGNHVVSAIYAPNPGLWQSTMGSRNQMITSASTATVLQSSPTYWAINQQQQFIATVIPTSGGSPGTPTGTVTFTVDGVSQFPVTLSGGRATLNWVFTSLGNHTVSAVYTPANANFTGSSAAQQQQNVRRPAAIAITSSSSTTNVAIGATVSAVVGGGIPGGSVSFYELTSTSAIFLGTANLNNNGAAAILADLASGNHVIKVVYSGDANFSPTEATAVIQGKTNGRVV